MYQIYSGLGRRIHAAVMWGVYIIRSCSGWVSVSPPAPILYRSVLGRTQLYRCAEAMTVFAVMTAGLFPILHSAGLEILLAHAVSELAACFGAVKSPLVGRVRDPQYLTVSSTSCTSG